MCTKVRLQQEILSQPEQLANYEKADFHFSTLFQRTQAKFIVTEWTNAASWTACSLSKYNLSGTYQWAQALHR